MLCRYSILVTVLALVAGCTVSQVSGGSTPPSAPIANPLDYDQAIELDAEALAEGGITEGYGSLLPQLARHVPEPATVTEAIDPMTPSYSVRCGDKTFVIYEPGKDDDAWAKATFALFAIVNDQLTRARSHYRLYAINAGNDLFGMFLTEAEVDAARASLPNAQDWPYLPDARPPWYGQPH